MPSFISDTALSKAWGEPSQMQAEAVQTTWMEKARSWLRKRRREDDEEKEKAPPKTARKKAAAWLVCVDHVFGKVCGAGLEAFRVPKNDWETSNPFD